MRNAPKVPCVVCHHDKVLNKGGSCNQNIRIADKMPFYHTPSFFAFSKQRATLCFAL